MPRFPGFIGGSNTSQSLIADAERTVNLYVERTKAEGAQHEAALYPTPGFSAWANVADVGCRGAIMVGTTRLFVVFAGVLWEFASTGTATNRGSVAQDGNPAQLIYNGVIGGQLGICSGGNVYSYNLTTNVLSAAVLSGGYTHLSYADGYGLAFNPTTGKVILSNLNDLSVFSVGNFFQRSKFPDPWQTMFVDPNGLIWLIGTETFEVWYDTGTGTQPWAPLSGLFGRYGIAAPFAYGVSGLGLFWLATGQEGGMSVVATKGSIPKTVSSYAVSSAITGYARAGRISDAEMLTYHDQGHTFANITFPTPMKTWSLDVEGSSWGERGQWNSVTGTYGVWAPRVHVNAFGRHLVGDRTTGTLWDMSADYATDVDGTGIRRLRRTPGLMVEHKRIPIDVFEILMDVGLGTASGAGSDPQAMLRVSSDGGRTWSNERRAGIGAIGQWRKRVYWNRLGASPDAVLEVVWSDPVPIRVIDAYVNNAERAA